MLRGVEGPVREPVGPARDRADRLDRRHPDVRVLQPGDHRARVPVLGRLRGRVRRPREADDAERRPAAQRRAASTGRSSARASDAPATPPGGWATSTCSRCSPSRTSRRSPRPASRRSWRPARTASTPSRTSTPTTAAPFEVVHHTELLSHLLAERRLAAPTPGPSGTVTYHDACYLGPPQRPVRRPPRRARGDRPHDDRDGARPRAFVLLRRRRRPHVDGGGRRARGSTTRGSPRPRRTGADTLAVACPYCFVMLDDAAKAKGSGMRVADVATLLAESALRRRAAVDSAWS